MRGAGTDRGEQEVNMEIKGLSLLATLFLAGRLLEEISKTLDGYTEGNGAPHAWLRGKMEFYAGQGDIL